MWSLQGGTKGIGHLAKAGEVTCFEYVKEIILLTEQKTTVERVDSERFQESAPAPKNEALAPIRVHGSNGSLRRP